MSEVKAVVIEQYRVHPKDTGSPEVQIALLSGIARLSNDSVCVNSADPLSGTTCRIFHHRTNRFFKTTCGRTGACCARSFAR